MTPREAERWRRVSRGRGWQGLDRGGSWAGEGSVRFPPSFSATRSLTGSEWPGVRCPSSGGMAALGRFSRPLAEPDLLSGTTPGALVSSPCPQRTPLALLASSEFSWFEVVREPRPLAGWE